jgi:hypothetical protein
MSFKKSKVFLINQFSNSPITSRLLPGFNQRLFKTLILHSERNFLRPPCFKIAVRSEANVKKGKLEWHHQIRDYCWGVEGADLTFPKGLRVDIETGISYDNLNVIIFTNGKYLSFAGRQRKNTF